MSRDGGSCDAYDLMNRDGLIICAGPLSAVAAGKAGVGSDLEAASYTAAPEAVLATSCG